MAAEPNRSGNRSVRAGEGGRAKRGRGLSAYEGRMRPLLLEAFEGDTLEIGRTQI